MSPPEPGTAKSFEFTPGTRRFFETSLDLLAVSTTDGRFVEVNPRFEEVLGWSRQELTSRPFIEFVHPDDREATLAALEKNASVDGTIRGFVNRYECKDGSYVWLEWQSRYFEEDGLIYASARNITDLRRARREKRRLQEQALRAHQLESVSELAGGIAHKLNNHLTTILGNAELLSRELEDSSVEQKADSIRQAASQAEELCRQLLAYSGEEDVDRRPEELSEIVKSSDQLLDTAVSEEVDLKLDLAESLPTVSLDPGRMRRVLMNLVANADDAICESGEIRIRTDISSFELEDFEGDLYSNELDAGRYVILEVSDTGRGMQPDIQERMFEPFFTTKFMGRGVGLAATLGIVRAHDGTILVDSEPGVGSTVTVLLPASEGPSGLQAGSNGASLPEGSLLVADDFSAVSLIRRTLSDSDIDIRTARSDKELFQLVRDRRDWMAVIVDPVHPSFREMQVVERLTERLGAGVPIIASTVRPSSDGPSRGDVAHADAVLEKPYSAKQLHDVVRKVVEAATTE